MDLDSLRLVAEAAAAEGASIVARRFGRIDSPPENKGRAGDWVTSADWESEAAIRASLERATPDIAIVGEEGGGNRGSRYWTVDPIDGTTNFLLGFPVVAVSVALVVGGRPEVAAIRAPLLDLSFSAVRGRGARCGDRSMAVSTREPERAIVAMALPFRESPLLPRYLAALKAAFERTEDVRRAGSAALDLAWVAAGVFDGYFELNQFEWDVAAGGLLVEEAGGVVTDWEGGPNYLSGNVIAGSPATHAVLLEAVRTS
jgi:myo-inositol-1(or 4)-monophosphatase